ncbi:hypothetical protein VTG60DRAFT_2505 [Thermothelomyces hinnuleus]
MSNYFVLYAPDIITKRFPVKSTRSQAVFSRRARLRSSAHSPIPAFFFPRKTRKAVSPPQIDIVERNPQQIVSASFSIQLKVGHTSRENLLLLSLLIEIVLILRNSGCVQRWQIRKSVLIDCLSTLPLLTFSQIYQSRRVGRLTIAFQRLKHEVFAAHLSIARWPHPRTVQSYLGKSAHLEVMG